MKLFDGGKAPNPRRVRVFLAEKGLEVPLVPVDMAALGHRSPEIASRNPFRRLPVLELDDGTVLTESVAICRYFEELHPEPALFGHGALGRATVEMWQRRIEFGLFAAVAAAFRHTHPAMVEWEVPQVQEWGEANRQKALEFLEILDAHLDGRSFVADDAMSIADITGLIAIDFMKPARIAIPDSLGNVLRWHAMLKARPSAAAWPHVTEELERLAARIRACRICVVAPRGRPLPHEPRPVVAPSATARILIAGQAPGTRVHASGISFDDASGDRLREWLGVDRRQFYDPDNFAIAAMGFCFPGQDARGADLPPRRECAPAWRAELMARMPQIDLVLAIGLHAHAWHMPGLRGSLAERIAGWRERLCSKTGPRVLPLPHPSWRNSGWLKRNPWFAADLLPALRSEIAVRVKPV